MSRKPTCFISYCREGMDQDSMKYLVQQLQDASHGEIRFLFDEQMTPGADVYKFMELVTVADGILIMLTPQYRERVEARAGGVYTEFSAIMARYQMETQRVNRGVFEKRTSETDFLIRPPFCLIPILFSSTFERACPKEIDGKLALDFSDYRALRRKNQNLFITGETSKKYRAKIGKIVSEILSHFVASTEEFKLSFEELLEKFFKTTKHEQIQDDPLLQEFLKDIFVKTHAFKKVRAQASYILIGRKGSGKSTITRQLALASSEKYKKHIEINVDDFDLDYLYSVLNTAQNRSELDVTIKQIQLFEIAWEILTYICCMDSLVAEYQANRLTSGQSKQLPPILEFLSKVVGHDIVDTEINHKALFRWCYAQLFEVKNDVIQHARDDLAQFSYDTAVELLRPSILYKVLGEDALQAFENILRTCKRRFLVSLDGFDTAFDEFRLGSKYSWREKDASEQKVQFELDWLRGFLHVTLRMKSNRDNVVLANLIDFCVMVPKDRFMEIMSNERDAYVYIGKYHDIMWSGIELAIMLRKRLELLSDFATNRSDRPVKRLETVLEQFPCIPQKSVVSVGGRDQEMPVFIDVLRHTFWRPREVLLYYAKIISVLRDFRKKKIDISQFTIAKCISDTTREIIKTEFIAEFQRNCTNLSEILSVFRRSEQILSLQEITEKLDSIHFAFADRIELEYDREKKIRFLYEVGFLGLEANATVVERLKLLHRDVFWFNAGGGPFEILQEEQYEGCRFVIHPIFCEYLDLDISNQRITTDFSWTYLEKQEAHMMI
jgi:energy-coupling factor transporter ATP-binding protein EcfA2